MTLAATLQPAKDQYGQTVLLAHARQSPTEHLGSLLDAIVLDGNVRAMEGVACVLARAGNRMQIVADAVLADSAHPVRLPLVGSASHTMAIRTARRALAGSIPDPSLGASAFHRMGDMPDWARGTKPLVQIGEIVFYAAAPRTLDGMKGG
jgi:hypothetical protein